MSQMFLILIFTIASMAPNYLLATTDPTPKEPLMTVTKSDDEWKKILPPETYHVAREKGTEPPFTGQYDKFFENGKYYCFSCDNYLFNSLSKFDSGTGWPSFYDYATEQSIGENVDKGNLFMPDRTEVHCQRCGAHLGHVFDDGPKPTGLRYCMNSVVLKFEPTTKNE
jgi:peptide-methionine (R)-S-oxide reductase